ncbi:MAG: hypothetical protein JJV94_03650 [Sulfurospirillum sp.]|nr:hypothetical protein [Sulfurospirillum sp.]
MGASRVCEGSTPADRPLDSECFGDYYQWGRATDGHEKVDKDGNALNNSISGTLASNYAGAINPANLRGRFIANSAVPHDWTTGDGYGNNRKSEWNKTNGSICPPSFKVPSYTEFFTDVGASMSNLTTMGNHYMRLSRHGYRPYNDTSTTGNNIMDRGTGMEYWTSENDGSKFSRTIELATPMYRLRRRAAGYPVRCVRY